MAQVREAVFGYVKRDEGRGEGVGPPEPEPDANHRRRRGQPVSLVHVGVCVEDLVVQPPRQRHLGAPEKDRRKPAPGERGQHQPAEPERLPEEGYSPHGRPVRAYPLGRAGSYNR